MCCCISQSLDGVQAIRSDWNFRPRSWAFGPLCSPQSELWLRAPATGVTENKQLIGRGPLDREVQLSHLSWRQTQLRLLQSLFWCIYVPGLCLWVPAWLWFCLTLPPNLPTMRVTNAFCSNEDSARRIHLNQDHKHDGWLKLLMNWKCLFTQILRLTQQQSHWHFSGLCFRLNHSSYFINFLLKISRRRGETPGQNYTSAFGRWHCAVISLCFSNVSENSETEVKALHLPGSLCSTSSYNEETENQHYAPVSAVVPGLDVQYLQGAVLHDGCPVQVLWILLFYQFLAITHDVNCQCYVAVDSWPFHCHDTQSVDGVAEVTRQDRILTSLCSDFDRWVTQQWLTWKYLIY